MAMEPQWEGKFGEIAADLKHAHGHAKKNIDLIDEQIAIAESMMVGR